MKSFLIAAGISLMASSALAQTSPQEFVDKAASGGLYEIQSSEIVLADASADAEVQAFAKQMIADHTKAAGDLKAAASKSGLSVPTAPDTKHAAMITELSGAGDKVLVYKKQQLDAHEEAVALHESYASAGTDPNLKAYAEASSPVLKMHLDHIKMLNGKSASAATGAATAASAGQDNMNANAPGVDSSASGGQGTGSVTSTAAPAN
jgi:putative membrane protein